jgi:hypothetical protein
MSTIINGTSNAITFPDGTIQTTAATGFASGTRMMFAQTSAPTGWTKDTTNYNNHAIRVVTGTASTGGSVDFTTAFASGLSDNAVTLSTSQIPSHTHGLKTWGDLSYATDYIQGASRARDGGFQTNAEGGGTSHTHTLPSFAVKYLDVITATAN